MTLPSLTTDAQSVLQNIRSSLTQHSFLQLVQYASSKTADDKFYPYAIPDLFYIQPYYFNYPI
jgi:hypothetical protein